jgi:hypothetical protein
MIYTKLIGGLGNQMFQYAVGRHLAKKHGTSLILDASGYENQTAGDTPREYELGSFKHLGTVAGAEELRKIRIATNPSAIDKMLIRKSGLNVIREEGFPFQPAVLDAPDDSYLIGYWQTEKYFADIREELLKDFTLANEPDEANRKTAEAIASCVAVSLHVRRGDYVTNENAAKFHGMTTLDYYREAIATMAEKVKKPHFFVFSDDPEWCQKNLKSDHPMTYVTNNAGDKGYEDMRLMRQCQHHIIANSSFSWWGAWLNPSRGKVVIAPGHWFNDTSVDTKDIYAQGWIKIGQ